jgi:transcriptional regulator with XRE-family HTH domain
VTDAEPSEIAARVRAVQAYADLTHAKLAAASGIGPATIARIASASDSRTAGLEERQKIAAACGVSPVFLEQGFAVFNGTPNMEQRLSALEELIREDVVPRLPSDEDLSALAKLAQAEPLPGDTERTAGQGRPRPRPKR